MGFFAKFFKKQGSADQNEPVLAMAITNTVLSEMYQDLLKENGIPFICRQNGAGGYMKHITGGLLVTDCIYVNKENYDKAKELYDNYIDGKFETENSGSEEQ